MTLGIEDGTEDIRLPGTDSGAELTALMEVVRDNAARLLSGVPHPPAVLRLRAGEVTVELEWHATPGFSAHTEPVPAVAVPARVALPLPVANGESSQTRLEVTAPSVGTFYHAPEPGAAPFVSVGDTVTAGQQVGIIEVMKIMLPVEADRSGRVVEILAKNGAQVEYAEPLLVLASADGE